jgi:hypothetical protein
VVALALAALVAAAFSVLGVGPGVRLLLTPLLFGGFVGVLQSRAHTCVALAARGQCDLGSGITRIDDPEERRAVQRKARSIMWQALGATTLVMAVVLLLP